MSQIEAYDFISVVGAIGCIGCLVIAARRLILLDFRKSLPYALGGLACAAVQEWGKPMIALAAFAELVTGMFFGMFIVGLLLWILTQAGRTGRQRRMGKS